MTAVVLALAVFAGVFIRPALAHDAEQPISYRRKK